MVEQQGQPQEELRSGVTPPMVPLTVAVTGDFSWDEVENETIPRRSGGASLGVDKVDVPSGALFVHHVLKVLFPTGSEQRIRVLQPLLPASAVNPTAGSQRPSLLRLRGYRTGMADGSPQVLRIASLDPLRRPEPPIPEDWAPYPESGADVLVIHHSPRPATDFVAGSFSSADAEKVTNQLCETVRTHAGKQGKRRIVVNVGSTLPRGELGDGRPWFPTDPLWQSISDARYGISSARKGGRTRDVMSGECEVWAVASITSLRTQGAYVSRRLSWEQAIEDLAFDLQRFPALNALATFDGLLIRFGHIGAVWLERRLSQERSGRFTFAPLARDAIYRDAPEDGVIVGVNTLMIASLLRHFAEEDRNRDQEPEPRQLTIAMQRGVLAGMRAYDRGYTWPSSNGTPRSSADAGRALIESSLRSTAAEQLEADKGEGAADPSSLSPEDVLRLRAFDNASLSKPHHTLGDLAIPRELLLERPGDQPRPPSPWQIIREQIGDNHSLSAQGRGSETSRSEGRVSRINLGCAIVHLGLERAINRVPLRADGSENSLASYLQRPECRVFQEETPDYLTLAEGTLPLLPPGGSPLSQFSGERINWERPVYAPVLTLRKLQTVERDEIETCRAIRGLLKNYAEDYGGLRKASRPTSIAVFGPPGSGKSFVVKQIGLSLNDAQPDHSKHFEIIEFNLAQFSDANELAHAFGEVANIGQRARIPLVFFDEFDSEKDGRRLGWLKYFLAPMQDGVHFGDKRRIDIGPCILVFAGGTSRTFDEFAAGWGDGPDRRVAERKVDNHEFKACKGPDFVSRLRGHINVSPFNTDPGMIKHIVRRAIMLRKCLEDRQLITHDARKIALIDPDIVYALLTIDRYRHGSRSLESIIGMCAAIHGRIEKASLPSHAQLDMHVNATELFIRVHRGRARPQPPADESEQNRPGTPKRRDS